MRALTTEELAIMLYDTRVGYDGELLSRLPSSETFDETAKHVRDDYRAWAARLVESGVRVGMVPK